MTTTTRRRPAFASPPRAAYARVCRRCEAPTMVGQDAEYGGCTAKIDVYPISNTGEIQALISGRMTYFLRWVSGRGRYEIDARNSFDITAHPADSVEADTTIVVEHRCGYPPVERAAYVTRLRRPGTETFPVDPPY